jgi:hypothetical protein
MTAVLPGSGIAEGGRVRVEVGLRERRTDGLLLPSLLLMTLLPPLLTMLAMRWPRSGVITSACAELGPLIESGRIAPPPPMDPVISGVMPGVTSVTDCEGNPDGSLVWTCSAGVAEWVQFTPPRKQLGRENVGSPVADVESVSESGCSIEVLVSVTNAALCIAVNGPTPTTSQDVSALSLGNALSRK